MDIFDDSHNLNQSYYFPQSPEYWLDINDYFPNNSTPLTQESQAVPEQPQRKLSDPFGPEPTFIPFEFHKSTFETEPFPEPILAEEEVIPIKTKQDKIAPSIVTKNVCFNICQKTIKVIQKDLYEQKLLQICMKNGVEKSDFIQHIVHEKKNFTGPKALQLYIEQETACSATFREYMKWFLKEKYLRHCLAGDMDNKEAYIKYKNEVILVILG